MLYDESVSSWLLIGIVSFGNRFYKQHQQQLNEENKNINCWLRQQLIDNKDLAKAPFKALD